MVEARRRFTISVGSCHLCCRYRLALLLILIASPSQAGLAYYTHVIKGGWELLRGRQSIEKLIADPETPETLRNRLEVALDARNFASDSLLLPDNKSYRKYKDLGRDFTSWTVVAAPELSLSPIEWCFPVAGCVSYRGYFSVQRAEEFAEGLRANGYDVDVGGVRAYSSLGWFADPVLNTFLVLPDFDLAGLIFHELAHQKLYLKGDTPFNEAFATVIENEGMRRWLDRRENRELEAHYRDAVAREERFLDLAGSARSRLEDIYQSAESDATKRKLKAMALQEVRSEYVSLKKLDPDMAIYDRWFGAGLNNARLLSVATYHDFEPGLRRVLARCGYELECFYDHAIALSKMTMDERSKILLDQKEFDDD